jgi:Tol biopolymer transport system component
MAEIYTVPLAGGVPRRLTDEQQDIGALMWTPDGRYITFASTRATQTRAWRVPAAGGPVEPEQVYPWVGIDLGSLRGSAGGSLSKDGQRFAFVQFQGGEPPAIWRADLSAPGGRALSNRKLISSQMYMASAQLSPDGARMVFQSGRTGLPEIWLSGAAGEDPLQLTSFGRLSGSPHWSPDSRWIAFDTRPHEYGQIFVIDVEGRNLHAVTSGEYENIVPSWSGDGKAIYFVSKRTGSYQIWKHVLANGAEMQLTRGGGFSPLEFYDGAKIYYTKFQQGGIWSIPANGGEESLVVPDMPQLGYWGYWTVTHGGLYLLDADAEPRPTIKFYSFATHRLSPVLSLEQSPRPWQPNLSASRDGRSLFYGEWSGMSVIEMAENFR